jgi:indolepyruvate ferredoxin oxidoreductase beta subunit
MSDQATNVVIAGLGGQGVLKASDILADAAFLAGLEVKKAEVHGMSQRGGSVNSDVRFGQSVLSPMVPQGQAHYLLVLEETQVENNRHRLADNGKLIGPDSVDPSALSNRKSFNVAMLGALSRELSIDPEHFRQAIRRNLPENLHEANFQAFDLGREAPAEG